MLTNFCHKLIKKVEQKCGTWLIGAFKAACKRKLIHTFLIRTSSNIFVQFGILSMCVRCGTKKRRKYQCVKGKTGGSHYTTMCVLSTSADEFLKRILLWSTRQTDMLIAKIDFIGELFDSVSWKCVDRWSIHSLSTWLTSHKPWNNQLVVKSGVINKREITG